MDIRQKIVDLRVVDKLPMRTIANQVGMSHERVRQILTEEGIPTARPKKPALARTSIRKHNLDPERIELIYGCSLDEVRTIQDGLKLSEDHSPARLYNLHRKRFQSHPGWEMTFPQWWELWRDHWVDREDQSLVMVVKDPDQTLTPNNVEIMTRAQRMELFWKQRRV